MTPEQRADNAERVLADHFAYVQQFLLKMCIAMGEPDQDAPANMEDTFKKLLKAAERNRLARGKASGEICTFCCGENSYMDPTDCVCDGSKMAAGQIVGMKALIQGNFLDRKRLSSKFAEEKRALTERATKAEILFREQTSKKYEGETLCIKCHNIGTVRTFIQCWQHNPNLLAASPENPQDGPTE